MKVFMALMERAGQPVDRFYPDRGSGSRRRRQRSGGCRYVTRRSLPVSLRPVGKKWCPTIYRDDVLIGVMDDLTDAVLVVQALNGRDVVPRVRVYSEPVPSPAQVRSFRRRESGGSHA